MPDSNEVHARREAAANPESSTGRLLALSQEFDIPILQAVAANPSTPVEALMRLVEHPNLLVKCALARNSVLPPVLWQALCNLGETTVREAIAVSPFAPDWALQRVCVEGSRSVRSLLCRRQHLPADVAALLAADSDWRVRELLAQNAALDTGSRDVLAKDPHAGVRLHTVRHDGLSEAARQQLAADASPWIRIAFTWHQLHDVERVRMMASDDDEPLVRFAADLGLEVAETEEPPPVPPLEPSDLVAGGALEYWHALTGDSDFAQMLCASASTPSDFLELMYSLYGDTVVHVVAANPQTPRNLRDYLLAERKAVEDLAINPSLTTDELDALLAEHRTDDVVERAAMNPSIARARLLDWHTTEQAWLRISVARNPRTSPKLLRTLAEDADSRVRLAVQLNDNCPGDLRSNPPVGPEDLENFGPFRLRSLVGHLFDG